MNGCPCGGTCCEEPEVQTPEHICDEGFCEGCFGSECLNCGSICFCDL